MDYLDYKKVMLQLLSDDTSYAPSTPTQLQQVQLGLKTIIDIVLTNGWINKSTSDFLFNEFPTTPVLYGLPKIHKGTNPLTFRPIVSGSGSATQPLAQFVDFFLQLVKDLPAYIKDTGDFLDKLRNIDHFENDWKLVTMDILIIYLHSQYRGSSGHATFFV